MVKKIKSIFFLTSIFTFIILITKHYFSDENIILTNKSRTSYTYNLYKNTNELPVLSNDTNNIIIYKNDLEEFKESRKKRFWEKLLSSDDE